MLVLTRKRGESIRIGNAIIFTIVEKSNGNIKIGIEAPPEIPIYREEVYQRIKGENRLAVVDESQFPEIMANLAREKG